MIYRQQHLQESLKEIGETAMWNEKIAKYYTDVHRPTRFRAWLGLQCIPYVGLQPQNTSICCVCCTSCLYATYAVV